MTIESWMRDTSDVCAHGYTQKAVEIGKSQNPCEKYYMNLERSNAFQHNRSEVAARAKSTKAYTI